MNSAWSKAVFGAPIVIWAHSFCRSTLSTYLEFSQLYPGEVKIVVCSEPEVQLRVRAGFRSTEYDRTRFEAVDPSVAQALSMLNRNRDAIQMFGAYHGSRFFRSLLDAAVHMNLTFFIAAEAPANMEVGMLRRLAKELYIPTLLRHRVRRFVTASEFFLCYSGQATQELARIGWPNQKVEEFGYYPPPLEHALLGEKLRASHSPLNRNLPSDALCFLVTGSHDLHKSPYTAVQAAKILAAEGFADTFSVIVAGEGYQTKRMLRDTERFKLPIDFVGFVTLPDLAALYRSADVFIGTGVREPWGIRVNDAMNAGCVAIVSDGMGAASLVRKSGAGLTYSAGSAEDLANKMKMLIQNAALRAQVKGALERSTELSPRVKAAQLLEILRSRLHGHHAS